jgi:predicted O-methyltransferase YrrM
MNNAAIEGFLDAQEIALLSTVGAEAAVCIVEIGSYRGLSTVALAQHASAPVYAIDPHERFISEDGHLFDGGADRIAFMRNLLDFGVADRVRLINLPSVFAARGWTQHPIDVLWIDGDHREAMVRADVQAWMPFLVRGGHVLLHDSPQAGVTAALRDIEATGQYERLSNVGLIAHYRKYDA